MTLTEYESIKKRAFLKPATLYISVKSVAKEYPKYVDVYKYYKPYTIQETPKISHNTIDRQNVKNDYIHDSLRRTKRTISDYVLCNDFNLFCTFTFDKRKIDRYNIEQCKAKMSKWLNNEQTKHGKFNYLIVPELHKDGAIHFHCIIGNYKGELIQSTDPKGKPMVRNKRKVYYFPSYSGKDSNSGIGYTDVEYIADQSRVSSYIRKYITKDMIVTANKKRYWCSKGLDLPKTTYNPEMRSINSLRAGESYTKLRSYTMTRYYKDDSNPIIQTEKTDLDRIRSMFPRAHLEMPTETKPSKH